MEIQQPNLHLLHIKAKTILLSTLDWGMGHTTRCVSIIKILLENNNTVIFAGNNAQCEFVLKEFPTLITLYLPGYNIQLDGNKNTYFQLLMQAKSFGTSIRKEKVWVSTFLKTNAIDIIISDNRYGFYNEAIPSIIITHQLNLQVPRFKLLANKRVKKLLENFDVCWVPDTKDHFLTGLLTQQKLDIPTHFIGWLNRLDKIQAPIKYDYLIILSGPEPERTNFLKNMLNKYTDSNLHIAFVGVDLSNFPSFKNPTSTELSILIAQSDTIISRAGYTTIMELSALNKKAILYPTKGQYEQVYLAKYLRGHELLTFVE